MQGAYEGEEAIDSSSELRLKRKLQFLSLELGLFE